MERIPRWYPSILHGFSVIAVPVCMMAVMAWEHPFLAIMMMPFALVAAILHLIAAIQSARTQRSDPWSPSPFARTLSWLVAAGVTLGLVVSVIQLETFPITGWAASVVVALAHVAFVLETRPTQTGSDPNVL